MTADCEAKEHTVTRADIEAMEDGDAKREACARWRQENGIPVFDALSNAADAPSEGDDEADHERWTQSTSSVPATGETVPGGARAGNTIATGLFPVVSSWVIN